MVAILLEDIANLTVQAGEIMLRNGAETSRVEDTMAHIARSCGVRSVESFVIPTGVFLTVTDSSEKSITIMRRVKDRTINLDRIAKVNELSRRLADSRIDYSDAKALLERIAKERAGFSFKLAMVASGLVGASYAILENGGLGEVAGAFFGAAMVRYAAHLVFRLHGVQFAFEFLGGLIAALVGTLLHSIWPFLSLDVIIVGCLMPLVPGVAITNAIRDVIAGDLLSGMSRGMEAAFTSVAVAMGTVIVLAIHAVR
jgi:uncharacterized membrane protein YjjP (DUF1212 family)